MVVGCCGSGKVDGRRGRRVKVEEAVKGRSVERRAVIRAGESVQKVRRRVLYVVMTLRCRVVMMMQRVMRVHHQAGNVDGGDGRLLLGSRLD